MKVLVTGGAGFLGANLVRRCLKEKQCKVTVVDSLDPRLFATTDHLRAVWSNIQFVQGSITDESVITAVVQDQDVIFNCAAQSSHPLSLQDPVFDAEINCLGNLRLLEAVRRKNKGATVVYTSSSTVIGKATVDPVDESHGEKPLDIYSANKGVAEKYHYIYHRVHDLNTVVLRFGNLYGPYGKGNPEFGFVNHFIHCAWNGEEIRIFGTGEQRRNLLYAEDAADVLFAAAQDKRLVGEVFFAAHDEHLSVAEVASTIVDVLGRGSVRHIEWADQRRRIEIDSVRISSARLRAITGWRPSCSFREGLERTRAVLQRGL